jgi:hypothetical protein
MPATYDDAAAAVLDRVHEFGECRVTHVDDPDRMRQAIRTEARRRKQRVRTANLRDGLVIAYAEHEHQSVEATVYNTVMSALVRDHLLDGDPAERPININVRVVDAREVRS